MPCLSIIVPIYNAEEYLFECLESIHKQDETSIEVIMIDDGSFDGSLSIIESFLSDARFRCYKQSNKGVSSARNLGLEHAKGEYLLFADSDDLFYPLSLQRLVTVLKDIQPELLFYGYDQNNTPDKPEGMNIEPSEGSHLALNCAVRLILEDEAVYGFIWNKVFKADVIKENDLLFDESIRISEDLLFCVKASNNIKKFYIIEDKFYFHRLGHESLYHSDFEPCKLSVISAYKKIISLLNEPSLIKDAQHKLLCILLPMARNNAKSLRDDESKKIMAKHFRSSNFSSFVLDRKIKVKYKIALILALADQNLLRFI